MQMTKSRLISIYLGIAIIAGLAAATYYQKVTEAQQTVRKLALAATPFEPLPKGTEVNDDIISKFRIITLPANVANSQLDWAMAGSRANVESLRGLVLKTDLQPGDFLRAEDFVDQSNNVLSLSVNEGKRAFSIPVRPGSAVGIFLTPGAQVDVLHTTLTQDERSETATLLEDVTLMAVGDFQSEAAFVQAGRPTYTSITVQANPDQIANFLNRTEASRGQLTVVLRKAAGESQ
ncbi:hypothetical protein ACMU_08895 [Actibacterium mucosum KCTC 23349]|uniref:Flp pilus assembly protein RcpC/CpaB domain-containing protein n=1 Tax=Actibacterium mucosum KCTC 23349 TaxID=1454373 RepID=A0A037ZHG9_9RHOB|nr:Flp pilus assembly protein CpaB [Actibacterium mucosum]KAJ55875.1 hypothetical protein ACMU_08895 [Actibacterium mucosum KCTC 23349]